MTRSSFQRIRYLSCRFDEATILSALVKVLQSREPLAEPDVAVLAALKRSSTEWDLPIDQISEKLDGYSEDQIVGLVNNVKGILHEMEFQAIENSDGDSVYAALFPDTNHEAVDIHFIDQASGQNWDVQLKATDNPSLIHEWLESNPDSEILITEELAYQMDLPSSGLSNEDLTVRVEDFVNRMLEAKEAGDDTIWDFFPLLPLVSSGIIVFELWRRYRKGTITLAQFKDLTIKTLGLKAAKYSAIFTALSIPGVNVVAGAYLLASFVLSSSGLVNEVMSFRPLRWANTRDA
jgi:hypothetical protein